MAEECLTRSDIARFLKISERQASRLMRSMPTVPIGRNQRRVLRVDFEEWLCARSEVLELKRSASAGRGVPRKFVNPRKSSAKQTVAEAAEALRSNRSLSVSRLKNGDPHQE